VTKTMRRGTHMKLFSPERANALIYKLEPLIEELLTKRRELAIKLLESDPALHHANPASRPRLAGMRSALPEPRFAELKTRDRAPDLPGRSVRLRRQRHRPWVDRFPLDARRRAGLSLLEARRGGRLATGTAWTEGFTPANRCRKA